MARTRRIAYVSCRNDVGDGGNGSPGARARGPVAVIGSTQLHASATRRAHSLSRTAADAEEAIYVDG